MWRHNDAALVFQIPVYIEARKFVDELGIKSVLDVGCGNPQKLKAYIRPHVKEIVGLDLPHVIEKIAETCGRWIDVDLNEEELDLHQTFGLIIAADVIEHLKSPIKMLELIKRHADEDTVILISTPDKDTTTQNNKSHEKEYGMNEMSAMLRVNGISIVSIKSYIERKAKFSYKSNVFLCKKVLS